MPDNYSLYIEKPYYSILEVSGYTTPAEAIGGAVVNVGNGLTKVGKTITLGGDLTGDTLIKGANSYGLSIGLGGGEELTTFNVETTGYSFWNLGETGMLGIINNNSVEGGAALNIMPFGFEFYGGTKSTLNFSNLGFITTVSDEATISLTQRQNITGITSFILSSGATASAVISSTVTGFKGLQYGNDYSVSFTDRSLTDKQFVTGYVADYATNNTVLLTTNQTIQGKKTFTPTASLAGINVGSLSSDPSSPANGDFWFNSSGPGMKFQANNTAYYLAGFTGSANNTGRIPIETTNRGILTDASNLTFASNTLTAGNTVSVVGGSINSPGGGNLGLSSAGAGTLMLGGSDGAGSTVLNIGAGGGFNFTSTNTPSGSSPDTGISRSAAGVLQINTTSKNGLGRLVVGGTTITNASTLVDFQATDKAVILTRVSADGNIGTAVNGMIYYNSTSHKFRGYANGVWVDLH